MEAPEPLYRVAVEVRFRDLDAYGHVNNAVLFSYLEAARVRFLGDRFSVKPQADDLVFLVKRAECEYEQPIPLLDRVFVELHVGELGSSSFRLSYDIRDDSGTRYARAETVMVAVSPRTGRPARLPWWLRQKLDSP